MATTQRNFIAGIMNKGLDERLVPNGQYTDALNVRLGSTEETEIGSVENAKGNVALTAIQYLGEPLSADAKCIGAVEDGANETIYWFVHDPNFTSSPSGKLDLIISLNVETNVETFHVISVNDGGGVNTTLNFNEDFLITGANLVDETLLFFTDNINPPRFINVTNNYDNPSTNNTVALTDNDGLPDVLGERLLVIKKPPLNSPQIQPQQTAAQNNFIEDRFCCFAYRYKYADNEYSATSQFSEPGFVPNPFNYSTATGLNDGMQNSTNQILITYNSGGPLVVGIDLLWKDMDTGVIKVIEKLDKENLGLSSNTDYTYTFSNSKIFTILPSSEILRLYDNVPLLAQAQTLMGNRLVYGNYLEQRDLTTAAGFPTQLVYTTELVSSEIGFEELEDESVTGTYTIDGTINVAESILEIDFGDIGTPLSNVQFTKDSSFSIQLNFDHAQFSGQQPFPNTTTQNSEIAFDIILQQDYDNLTDFVNSQQFQDRIGTVTTIQPMADACDGSTFTDEFNCIIPLNLDNLTKFDSGITGAGQALRIIHTAGTSVLGIQLLAVEFVDDPLAITQRVYEYYKISAGDAIFQEVGNPKSLHSNRSYEVGIVYMDDYNRATTVQVSENNTVSVPCSQSDFQNMIRVTIPTQQIAPSWATRYKFCIKSDKEGGFNVYSNFFFRDQTSGADYFLLEGENSQKIDEGDILQIKTDVNGAMRRCAFGTVLEKKSQPRSFLDPPPQDAGGTEIPLVSGTYMKMRANEFSIDQDELPVVAPGKISSKGSGCRIVNYPVTVDDGNGQCIDYTIPAGSRIRIFVENFRKGKNNVSRRLFISDGTYTASQDYDNFQDWFNGDNIAQAITGNGDDNGTNVDFNYISGPNGGNNLGSCSVSQFYAGFRDINGCTVLTFKSTKGYSGDRKNAKIEVRIEVIRTANLIAFETKPQDSLPDVWYESSVSYPIIQGSNKCQFSVQVDTDEPQPIQFDYKDLSNTDASIIVQPSQTITGILGICGSMVTSPSTPPVSTANITIDSFPLSEGTHTGNVQNQTANAPAIIDTAFFNCFSMGNGVESFQILDSIKGKPLELGNRVLSTNNQDYQQILRFADLTYSGVFNDESNVNKLNEFNLGLLNFKPLEESFGPVQKLDARETDILTLQEDKISYVLAGKNLLSDSTGGGQVASVPEVLGTQIARIEEYGISHNPESYAKWGPNKFFTDAKRGAVIQLRGSSGQSEALQVISEAGMRSFFRDLFLNGFATQKLGGYDPYMNEYVLSANTEPLPIDIPCIDCGITRTLVATSTAPNTFCVDVGNLVGDVSVDYNVISNVGSFSVNAVYNGQSFSSGSTTTSGSFIVDKDVVAENTVEIEVLSAGTVTLELTINCPSVTEITIIQVCYSLDADAGKFIHNEYSWTDGAFVSPLHSASVELISGNQNPLISQYDQISGPQGGGFIPANSATVTIKSNRIQPIDDYVFDPTIDELRFLRTNTFYANTPNDMAALLAASTNATPILGGPDTYQADFAMPNTNENFLYLIYNYRRPTAIELCFGISQFDACCDCSSASLLVRECTASLNSSPATYIVPATQGITVGSFIEVSADAAGCVYEVIQDSTDSPNTNVSAVRSDITNCNQVCQTYTILNNSNAQQTVNYGDCDNNLESITVQSGSTETICATSISTYSTTDLTITKVDCECNVLPPNNVAEIESCDALSPTTSYVELGKAVVQVGDFITVNDGSSPACVWKVISLNAQQTAVYSINTVLTGINDCSEICQTYTVENTSPDTIHAIQYNDCNDQQVTENVGIGQTITICARDITGIVAELVITKTSCACALTFYEIQLCEISDTNLAPNGPTTGVIQDSQNQLSVGDHVFIGGCAYLITGVSAGPETITFDSFSPSYSCDQQCNTYEITNNSNFNQTVEYIDCSQNTVTVQLEPTASTQICTTQSLVSSLTDCTIQLVSCACDVAENFEIEQCRADGVTQTAIVADTNPASLKIGDFVSIITSPDCVWEVVDTTSELPTETVNVVEDNITDCSQVCQEYTVFNSSANPLVYSYTNCAGQSVNVSIPAGDTITVAATALTTATGIVLTLVDCVVNNLQVTQCRLDNLGITEIVPADAAYQVGDFVNLDTTGVNCVWVVTNRVPTALTGPTITNIATTPKGIPLTDCDQVCQTYEASNIGQASETFVYEDCDGNQQSITIEAGQTEIICVSASVQQPQDIDLLLTDCDCTVTPPATNYALQECSEEPNPQTVIAANNLGGLNVNVGDFVNLQGSPNCVWEVIAVSASSATEVIASISTVTECFEVCQEYTLTNTSAILVPVDYIGCFGVKISREDIPAFGSAVICVREFINVPPGINIVKTNCQCQE